MTNPTNQWQDISSAPKDGTVILGRLGERYPFFPITWAEGWCAVYPGADNIYDRIVSENPPTHWMIPEPPSAAKESEVCDDCAKSVILPHECPNDPAAQPNAIIKSAHGHGPAFSSKGQEAAKACAASVAAAQTPDRAEGEGPYKELDSIELTNPQGFKYSQQLESWEVGIANAAYLEGQESTGDWMASRINQLAAAKVKIERLERIEVAAKELDREYFDTPVPIDHSRRKAWHDLHTELRAALTSNEGER